MEHASETPVSMVAFGRRIKQMAGGAVIWSQLSSSGLTSAAATVVGDAVMDADDASGDDTVDVALVSTRTHTVEHVEGVTERRSLSSVAVAAAGSGIPPMGTALLRSHRGAAEVAVAESPTGRSYR